MRASLRLATLALFFTACDDATPLGVAHPILELATTSLDFGAVPEGEQRELAAEITNAGQVSLTLSLALDPAGSRDFSLSAQTLKIEPTSKRSVTLTFTPEGAGSDSTKLLLTSDDPERPNAEITVLGGPIAPMVAATPDPLDFGPAGDARDVARPISVHNRGQANLHLSEILIDPAANTDFTLRSIIIPEKLSPDGEIELVIDYRRTERGTPGRLLIRSDDPAAPELAVRLIPDPLRACEDTIDNDGDGLRDFPDDPGCTSAADDDEENPPECEEGATSACGSELGECALGTRSCVNRLWGPCSGDVGPTAELCDGLDNDCDDRVDDGISEACSTNGCDGVRACVEGSSVSGGEWSACIAVNSSAELCDGIDNDCSGTVDEGIVEVCDVNGCSGQRVCIPGGGGEFTACQVATSAEVCDGADNDCNGIEDDNIADLTCGMGLCARTADGCTAGLPGTCTPGQPATEVCNGQDDNCDGNPDNNIPNITCGMGLCARSVAGCVNGSPGTCTPGQPATEVCNSQDDNCDGVPDNNIPNITCGMGLCARSVAGCVNGSPGTCTPGQPATEVCNGQDDNCDGNPDNNIPNITCGTGQCARSVVGCVNGTPGTCTPGQAVAEICNGLDDDCDGTPDNGVCAPVCGLASNAADPREPNNSPATSNPAVANQGFGTFTHDYDLTLTPGDSDWLEFRFPPPATGTFAQLTASITCASWFGVGCGASAPAVGLEAWYFDDCFPQQDDADNGQAGLASVSSAGQISPFGFCGLQRFRVHVTASTNVCTGEALNAHLRVQLTWSP